MGCVAVFDLELKEDYSRLGMESRSILKSIQTEEMKLSQSPNFTRSDLHYFRARHNYYRLSLLRLPVDERSLLEPFLARFFERIVAFERMEGGVHEKSPAPFLQSVERFEPSFKTTPAPETFSAPSYVASSPSPEKSQDSSSLLSEVLDQLELVRLALTGEATPEARKVLVNGVERIISKIKAAK